MDELKGIQSKSDLSAAFFSRQNIESIQITLRHQVWLRSNKKHVIGNQSVGELKVIMRSIYLQNALNNDTHILDQVRELNKLVLEYATNQILTQLEQYVEYTRRISSDRYIIPHSVNTSIRGSRQLEQKPW